MYAQTAVSTNIPCSKAPQRPVRMAGNIDRTFSYMSLMLDQLESEEIYKDETFSKSRFTLSRAAELCDIGMILVPEEIVNKPGKLTDDEYEVVQAHTALGVGMIERIGRMTGESDFLRSAAVFTASHHERWDGSGYPEGLMGYRIPIEGRLMGLIDAYDAMISERPYKTAVSCADACKVINEGRGRLFDPILVDIFNTLSRRFAQIAMAYR